MYPPLDLLIFSNPSDSCQALFLCVTVFIRFSGKHRRLKPPLGGSKPREVIAGR